MRHTNLVDPLNPEYCELNYILDDEEMCRFQIKILKFVDKIETVDYPLCVRAKHLGPQGMRIDVFKHALEKIERGDRDIEEYESWKIDNIDKSDVEFPSFYQNNTRVTFRINDEHIKLVRSS